MLSLAPSIYNIRCKLTSCVSTLQVLLPAASLLQLMDVRQVCCEFLQSQLHPTNCLGIRAFADLHTCTQLLNQAHAYAGKLLRVHTTDRDSSLPKCVCAWGVVGRWYFLCNR